MRRRRMQFAGFVACMGTAEVHDVRRTDEGWGLRGGEGRYSG